MKMAEFRKRVISAAKEDYLVAKNDEYRTMLQYKTEPSEEHAREYWHASNKTTMERSRLENLFRENMYRPGTITHALEA